MSLRVLAFIVIMPHFRAVLADKKLARLDIATAVFSRSKVRRFKRGFRDRSLSKGKELVGHVCKICKIVLVLHDRSKKYN